MTGVLVPTAPAVAEDDTLGGAAWSDEELTALALAADPDLQPDADAPSVWELLGLNTRGDLPEWYMPVSVQGGSKMETRPWHRRASLLVIVSLLLINASGLCITYGHLVWA